MILAEVFLIIQFMSMQAGWAASQLASYLSSLRIYILRRGSKFAKGTSFGWIFIWSGQTDFGGGKSLISYINILSVYSVRNGKR